MLTERAISIKCKLSHPCIKSIIKPIKDYGLVYKSGVLKKILNKLDKIDFGIYWYQNGSVSVSRYLNNIEFKCNKVYLFRSKNREFTITFNVPYFEPFNHIKHIQIENKRKTPGIIYSLVDVPDTELWYICILLNEFMKEKPLKSYLKNV